MPINLPPEAQAAEQRYRDAKSTPDRIAALETYISLIPKHKGTDHLRADLRRRLAKLRDATQSGQKTARFVSPYRIDREGAGQVVLVGPPNVGKSSVLNALTHATPEVSPAPFSTWEPTPGMMPIDNIQVQLIDTPPLNPDHVEPEFIELVRRAELVLFVVDMQGQTMQQIDDGFALLARYGIVPRGSEAPGVRATADGRRVTPVNCLIVVNKVDDAELDEDFALLLELYGDHGEMVPLSADTGRHVDAFKQRIYELLELIRVYAKPPGKDPDFSAPFVLHVGDTIEEFAAAVHQDFVENLKSARVWGTGVYDGQPVGRDHALHDGDVVELRL